jgi:hypothetical protein
MARLTRSSILALAFALLGQGASGCAAFDPACGTPNAVTVEGKVVDGAGKPLAFEGALCVRAEYCEPTFSGCDPPNHGSDCMHVVTDANGSFSATLHVSSPDPKDLITWESFSLGKAEVTVRDPRGDDCHAQSLTFVSP